MSLTLDSLASCFQGLIPATLYTCSADGTPNVAYLSHVDYVDPRHVALSFQFFNKSHKNIAENPRAVVRVIDPDDGAGYEIRLRFVRSENEGPVFERMALRIEAIASMCGLKGIFKLLASDIYEVLSIKTIADEGGIARPAARGRARTPRSSELALTMKALQDLSDRINRAENLECLLESILAALEEIFGFGHAMILLAGEQQEKVVTIASRGYPENGAGAEVGYGEGIIGMVAEARKPIRITGLLRQMLYAYAVKRQAEEKGVHAEDRRIPLPGLAQPDSQLGIPLLVRDELVGVLCVESETPYRFHEQDKVYFEVLGSYLAIAIQNMLLHERSEAAEEGEVPATLPRGSGGARSADEGTANDRLPHRELTYYKTDECILVDGEYLIRSLPAKILWKILTEHDKEGRSAFSNRELRLDKSLSLPDFKDNLESRLLLLRRRLEQKCPAIRLIPCARGKFSLDLACRVSLSERP